MFCTFKRYIYIYLASSQTFLSFHPWTNPREDGGGGKSGKRRWPEIARYSLTSVPSPTRHESCKLPFAILPFLFIFWKSEKSSFQLLTPLYSFHSIPSSSKLSIMSNRPTILPIEKSSKNSRRDEDIISFNRAIESDRWDADFLKERIAYVFQIRIKSLARSLKFLSPG